MSLRIQRRSRVVRIETSKHFCDCCGKDFILKDKIFELYFSHNFGLALKTLRPELCKKCYKKYSKRFYEVDKLRDKITKDWLLEEMEDIIL